MESKQKAAYLAVSAFVILTLALSVLTVCRVLAKAADARKFEYPAAVSVFPLQQPFSSMQMTGKNCMHTMLRKRCIRPARQKS